MEYMRSNYVFSQQHEGKTLLFNTLTNKFYSIDSDDGFNYENLSKQSRQWCVEEGLFIDEKQKDSQRTMAYSKYLNSIYDNKLNITIMLTEQCNFRCKYCYENFTDHALSVEVQNALILYLKKNLSKYSGLVVSWFGGEPLLETKTILRMSEEFLRLCQLCHIPYHSNITTNGYLLTPELLLSLAAVGVKDFRITLDGIQDNHDKVRVRADGAGTFNTILQNLIGISKIKRVPFSITLRSNLTKQSLTSLNDYISLLVDNFSSNNRFSYFFKGVGDWGGTTVKEIKQNLLSDLGEFYQKLLSAPILNYMPYYYMLTDGQCCSSRKNQFVVKVNGDILKCMVCLDREENKIGKLTRNGTLEIDENKVNSLIFNSSVSNMCTQCYYFPHCGSNACVFNKGNCSTEVQNYAYILPLLYRCDIAYQQHIFKKIGV